MPSTPQMIDPDQAWQRILKHLSTLPPESVARRDAAGRVLAEQLMATVDVPALDVSAMDGFAVGGNCQAGDALRVQGTIAAGDPPGVRLEPRATARIMTGAPVPLGTDRVIPVELTTTVDPGTVEMLSVESPGSHIRLRGEVIGQGADLLAPGTPLTPGALGLLATHGHEAVSVYQRPRVAVLATGDEVVPPDVEPKPGQLRDSHTDFLLAAGRSLRLDFEYLGIAPDSREEMRARITRGIDFDILLIGGGVSMGEFDFVEDILTELGCEIIVDAVSIQPGKPLVVAHHPKGLVFGLPGNPASVMVGFWLFVRPALRRLQGISDGFWSGALIGELEGPLPGAKGRDRFLSAIVRVEDGRLKVRPRQSRGSHDVDAFASGSALVRVPAGAQPAGPGGTCEILPFANWPTWTG